MMHQVPPSTSEKEKILGGLLTLGQTAWLATGVVSATIVFIINSQILGMGKLGLIFAAPFLLVGVPFAFPFGKVKRYEMTLFDYLKRKQHFKRINKKLPNYRKEADL